MTLNSFVDSLDTKTKYEIEQRFLNRQQVGRARKHELFDIFEKPLTEEEIWALKYLYAFMPVNDLADYDGDLFLSHVRQTLKVRDEVAWGHLVPDYLFLHFVLPYRVNTENIEDSRGILYEELSGRTQGLSMKEAILETNYWCHEKATYIASDQRTASPLTLIRSARGRCGEESTLAVAALRSIGIPARQVYTPRWAHCDDNHAWVEAWADGQWYYFGACEPEPCLNRGWFTPPSRRAMLVNTRVLADYPGPEDITLREDIYTEINLLEGYAKTRTLSILVTDPNGTPAADAEVHFELYNMAEFYPLASLFTNEEGRVSFKTGHGDLLVRAVKDGRWGEMKAAAADGDHAKIVLDKSRQPEGTLDLDMVPPPEGTGEAPAPVSDELLKQHQLRLEEGSRLRSEYESTFIQEEQVSELARSTGLPCDRLWDVLRKARGNGRELYIFLLERCPEYGEWPLLLLESLNEKDLIDTFRETLDDHLTGGLTHVHEFPEDIFVPYVLCPRVWFEMIAPYRQLFQRAYSPYDSATFRADPALLMRRLTNEIEIDGDLPGLRGKGTAAGTYKLKRGDQISVGILFVALCRSLGIPARLHPIELKPEYWSHGKWEDALPDVVSGDHNTPAARLILQSDSQREGHVTPSYYENFTLARLESGWYKTLIFPYAAKDLCQNPLEVEPGAYRMTTGIRLPDGSVRVRFSYFPLLAGEETTHKLSFREESEEIPVLGQLDRNARLASMDGRVLTLGELTSMSGALAAWIEPEREPTQHLIREMSELKDAFDDLGVPVILILGSAGSNPAFDASRLSSMPVNTVLVRDHGHQMLDSVASTLRSEESGFPHLFVLDGNHRIRFSSSGYRIGTGQDSWQLLDRLSWELSGEGGVK
ncbi:transglutaminase domain-containing protein [Paenibacillus sp. J22TS3]|uniref:transglutaminase domain-containing protein n=1 Tax=Paenibacillus sp. J22TS3 TaxID=2807192 RepID=UPI001B0EA1FA|nr:transglutaminase-like domain-containing protein [Paenibacillus sp. J22TS3]GIP19815.1 transglutaminase [Paenibacillus sp. J22TS3]